MTDAGNILNDDDFFGDIFDTPQEGIEQRRKRECLKSVIDKGEAHLLRSKWTQEKASDEIINKTYAEYRQREITKKGEKTVKALGKPVINLRSTRISQVVKIRDVKKLRQDIEDGPIIKDQMNNLGCLLVRVLGNNLMHVLVGLHIVNNYLGPSDEQDHENEGYESDHKI